MKTLLACTAGLLLCGPLNGWSQDARSERLDTVAKSFTTGNAFMGAVLVAEGDRVLLDKGYGSADLEWNIPNAPDVRFRLGSLTKQFTAALVLLLQQDGKLRLDDPVAKHLPDAPKTWEKITLANLLGHTSGIPNFTNDKSFGAWSMSPHTHAEEIAFFRNKPLDFEPGSQWAYSNSNYALLGAIIEAVSGREYSDLLRERLCGPLGMQNTGMDTDELILPRRAQGYEPGANEELDHPRSESMTVPWAAGGLYSTTGDLWRWERGLFGGKVLNPASLQAMTTAGKGNYGLGVEVAHRSGVEVVEHAGGIEGFTTQLSCVPARGIVVVVLSNVNGTAPGIMAEQLLDVTLGRPVVLASERKPVPIRREELEKFVGVYDFSPDQSVAVEVRGDELTMQGSSHIVRPMMYQGIGDGRARFFVPTLKTEVEFVTNGDRGVASMILHLGGEATARKR